MASQSKRYVTSHCLEMEDEDDAILLGIAGKENDSPHRQASCQARLSEPLGKETVQSSFCLRRGNTATQKKHKDSPPLQHLPLRESVPKKRQYSESVTYEELLNPAIKDQLYDYQQRGVEWLLERHQHGSGAILADEMGLGKTVQIAALLGGLLRCSMIKTVLIVAPPTLLSVWEDALKKWGEVSSFSLVTVHQEGKEKRERHWRTLGSCRNDVVMLTTYGLIKQDIEKLSNFSIDYIVLDEAQQIKDPATQTHKAVVQLNGQHRIAATGTPVMNKFMDLWAIMKFVDEDVIGMTRAEFSKLNSALLRGNQKDASVFEKEQSTDALYRLKAKIDPYTLRREKKNVTQIKSKKHDVVLWMELSEVQRVQYVEFLKSDRVREALKQIHTNSPIILLSVLKKLCDHTWLNLTQRNYRYLMSNDPLHQCLTSQSGLEDFGNVLDGGSKLAVTVKLLKDHIRSNERTLVFSQSRRILEMLSCILKQEGILFTELHGDVQPEQRGAIVQKFNEGRDNCKVCLLTTQVGGVGLTFTSASRVIIFDPHWNPAVDAQAVDRVHRIGQEKDVVIYRLITSGTVEEKIYRNQIFKMMAARQMMGASEEMAKLFRYFTQVELRSMFELGDTRHSATAVQLRELHGDTIPPALHQHLHVLSDAVEATDHTLMFSIQEDISKAAVDAPQQAKKRKAKKTPSKVKSADESQSSLVDFSDEAPLFGVKVPPKNEEPKAPSVTFSETDLCSVIPSARPTLMSNWNSLPNSPRCSIFDQPALCADLDILEEEGELNDEILHDTMEGADIMFRGINIPKLRLDIIQRNTMGEVPEGIRVFEEFSSTQSDDDCFQSARSSELGSWDDCHREPQPVEPQACWEDELNDAAGRMTVTDSAPRRAMVLPSMDGVGREGSLRLSTNVKNKVNMLLDDEE